MITVLSSTAKSGDERVRVKKILPVLLAGLFALLYFKYFYPSSTPRRGPQSFDYNKVIEKMATGEKPYIFTSAEAKQLFRNKHIVVIGDSIQRGVYKDLVLFLQKNRLIINKQEELKGKAEPSFMGDRLVFRTQMTNGSEFVETREYQEADVLVQYYFVTRCYDNRVETILQIFKQEPPDIVIMNSALWDITRYGDDGEEEYIPNMRRLLSRLREVLPKKSMFIWTSTPPVASLIDSRSLLPENIAYLGEDLRIYVLEWNYRLAQLVGAYGFDYLDLHYYLRCQMNNRSVIDGVHWNEIAHRHITELIMIFLYDSWGEALPPRAREILRNGPCGDGRLTLKHFAYDGAPAFSNTTMEDLGEIADRANERKINDI